MQPRIFPRIYFIDARIRAGRHPSVAQLAADLEVSPRTVERDLAQLKNQIGAPLTYDHTRGGYAYADHRFRLPPLQFTGQEVQTIHLATGLLGQAGGRFLAPAARRALEKMLLALPEGVSADQGPTPLSFGLDTLRGEETLVAANLETLYQARQQRRTLEMTYHTAARDTWTRRRLNPYHLHYRAGAWYAIGWCHARQTVRTFAVDRMRELQVLDETYCLPPGGVETYFAGAWQFERGETAQVVIRFHEPSARYVRERHWHPSQQIAVEPGGTVRFEVAVYPGDEVKRWVLQFGAEAEVLEPASLRAAMTEEIRRMHWRYPGVAVKV